MFRAVRLKSLRLTILSLVGVILFAMICLIAVRGSAADTIEVNGEKLSLSAEDETDVERFLTACGCEEIEFLFENEITIPKNWNDTYIMYNELQRQQGFDLTPYKGKTAEKREFFVSGGRNATVLTHDGKIVAAHLCNCDGTEMRIIHE